MARFGGVSVPMRRTKRPMQRGQVTGLVSRRIRPRVSAGSIYGHRVPMSGMGFTGFPGMPSIAMTDAERKAAARGRRLRPLTVGQPVPGLVSMRRKPAPARRTAPAYVSRGRRPRMSPANIYGYRVPMRGFGQDEQQNGAHEPPGGRSLMGKVFVGAMATAGLLQIATMGFAAYGIYCLVTRKKRAGMM